MLSTNEVKARAAEFSREWQHDHYERGEAQSFYNEFFEIFGMKRRKVATFEEVVKRLGDKRGFLDLFWKGVLLAEHKSAGKNLEQAKRQALDYFPSLKDDDLPRYLLICDFQNFELYDLDEGTDVKFKLADLHKHVEAFNFVRGLEKRTFKDQDPANIKAAELVGKLHDALEESDYTGNDLERFLVRIVFCLFADDTGIFDRDIFLDLIARTRDDGGETGNTINALFEVLNTPEDKRQKTLSADLDQFPHVNGDLFKERLRPVSFDSKMRRQLIAACEFNWSVISPAIFGALFQSVMEPTERRRRGAHYTTELNILKLIRPLFLDDLHAEFEDIKQRKGTDRRNKLAAFQNELSGLTFFDPACGCGNFLIITYRELRRLEIELLKEIYPSGQQVLDVTKLSKLDVNQFYGIEIEEFSARIAETAMWMMDHIMNNELSLAFGQNYARIPLKKSATIKHADALETDWVVVLPSEQCSYIFGNPPFSGSKHQDEQKRAQSQRIAALGGSGGTLDYVTSWFLKASEYVQPSNCNAQIAFVATNSITQGEQVAQFWPLIFNRYRLEINFAHRTFMWGSEVKTGKAHVHVVILGLSKCSAEWMQKRLFSYDDINGSPVESRHKMLSPYLFDASNLRDRHLVVAERGTSLCDAPKMIIGSKPIDGGYLQFESSGEKDAFISAEPKSLNFIRPYVGGQEYINGGDRWILALQSASAAELRSMPQVMKRLEQVTAYREGKIPSRNKRDGNIKPPGISSRSLADRPAEFHVTVVPQSSFLAVPEVSSETRRYIPIGWLSPPIIPSNKLRFLKDADLWQFGVLTSRMHMAWTEFVGGRLESRFQYSIGINYNPFPWPSVQDSVKEKIRSFAQEVLDARASFPNDTLADLYDPRAMPQELRKAHRKLDDAVDALYKRGGFDSDRTRVEHLFALYEKLVAPLTASAGKKKRLKKAG